MRIIKRHTLKFNEINMELAGLGKPYPMKCDRNFQSEFVCRSNYIMDLFFFDKEVFAIHIRAQALFLGSITAKIHHIWPMESVKNLEKRLPLPITQAVKVHN